MHGGTGFYAWTSLYPMYIVSNCSSAWGAHWCIFGLDIGSQPRDSVISDIALEVQNLKKKLNSSYIIIMFWIVEFVNHQKIEQLRNLHFIYFKMQPT